VGYCLHRRRLRFPAVVDRWRLVVGWRQHPQEWPSQQPVDLTVMRHSGQALADPVSRERKDHHANHRCVRSGCVDGRGRRATQSGDSPQSHSAPPSWKIVMTVVLALFPTVMLLAVFPGPYTAPLGFAAAMLIGNFLSVSILSARTWR